MLTLEKKNRKLREAGRREFSGRVRELAQYVRKKDPRYLKYMLEVEECKSRSRQMAEDKKEQEKVERIGKRVAYKQDWMAEDSDFEVLECIVCDVSFDKKAALDIHILTEPHLKALDLVLLQEGLLNTRIAEVVTIKSDQFQCSICVKTFLNDQMFKIHNQTKKHKTRLRNACR